jgi:hypothetical protein
MDNESPGAANTTVLDGRNPFVSRIQSHVPGKASVGRRRVEVEDQRTDGANVEEKLLQGGQGS